MIEQRQIVINLRNKANKISDEVDTMKRIARKELKAISRERMDHEVELNDLDEEIAKARSNSAYWEGQYEAQEAL